MSYKSIKIILQGLLLAVIAVIPFIRINSLYFPFVSGKVYGFRLLVSSAFFFCVWLLIKDYPARGWFLPIRQAGASGGKNILLVALVLFFLAQIVVSIFGVSPALSFFSTIERQDGVIQYGFWVLYFLMLVFAFKEKKDWKILFSVFIITAFLVSCYSWINLANQGRLAGVFGNPSYLAAYLLFAIGFCAIAIKRKFFEGRSLNGLLLAISGFFTITIFYTQTRGVYLALAFGIFLFCLLSVLFLRKQNKKLAVVCAIVLVTGLVSVAGLFLARETNFVKNNGFLVRITEVTNFWELGSIRERLLTWEIALKAFQDKPIFGYGPENFMVAFNKYYDFRIGTGDSWFDRAHNQLIEPLATGGIALFSFYIFLLASVFYTIFKISKKDKILSFILSSFFLAYIIQGIFLFDTLPVYLGLFPFLAFIVYECAMQKSQQLKASSFAEATADKEKKSKNIKIKLQKTMLITAGFISLFSIYTTVFLPYAASASAIQFMAGTEQGYYKKVIPFAEKTFNINSPYTYWELRKRVGWQTLFALDGGNKFTDQEVKDLGELYDFVVPELERFVQNRPFDPQIYYVLPRIYRLGYEKLGKDDLQKAYALLEQSFDYSDLRFEYYNEMARVLLVEGKFSEGEKLLKDYADRIRLTSFDYSSSWLMGNYYYVAGEYDLAMQNYVRAGDEGYDFIESDTEYSRYVDTADKTKNYQEIVDMSLKYIDYREQREPPNADVYFNVALGYYYLSKKAEAKEFFLKATELDKEQYQKYEQFFSY